MVLKEPCGNCRTRNHAAWQSGPDGLRPGSGRGRTAKARILAETWASNSAQADARSSQLARTEKRGGAFQLHRIRKRSIRAHASVRIPVVETCNRRRTASRCVRSRGSSASSLAFKNEKLVGK